MEEVEAGYKTEANMVLSSISVISPISIRGIINLGNKHKTISLQWWKLILRANVYEASTLPLNSIPAHSNPGLEIQLRGTIVHSKGPVFDC